MDETKWMQSVSNKAVKNNTAHNPIVRTQTTYLSIPDRGWFLEKKTEEKGTKKSRKKKIINCIHVQALNIENEETLSIGAHDVLTRLKKENSFICVRRILVMKKRFSEQRGRKKHKNSQSRNKPTVLTKATSIEPRRTGERECSACMRKKTQQQTLLQIK